MTGSGLLLRLAAGMRLDRILTLHLMHPVSRRLSGEKSRVPILMYHSISEPGAEPCGYHGLRTSPGRFREQMRLLHDEGFQTLEVSHIRNGAGLVPGKDGRAVVITFDDAYEDFLTKAFPVLNELGLGCQVYVPTGLAGKAGPLGSKLLDWGQIQQLHRSGVKFGSHTVSHPKLQTLMDEHLRMELADSRKRLEDALGARVQDFSHPFAFPEQDGSYTWKYKELLKTCGYSTAVTTIIGTAARTDDPFLYRRIPVNEGDDARLFRAKLDGAYDWLHPLQYFWKTARAMFR